MQRDARIEELGELAKEAALVRRCQGAELGEGFGEGLGAREGRAVNRTPFPLRRLARWGVSR